LDYFSLTSCSFFVVVFWFCCNWSVLLQNDSWFTNLLHVLCIYVISNLINIQYRNASYSLHRQTLFKIFCILLFSLIHVHYTYCLVLPIFVCWKRISSNYLGRFSADFYSQEKPVQAKSRARSSRCCGLVFVHRSLACRAHLNISIENALYKFITITITKIVRAYVSLSVCAHFASL